MQGDYYIFYLKESFNVGCLHNSPSSNVANFMLYLEKIFDTFVDRNNIVLALTQIGVVNLSIVTN